MIAKKLEILMAETRDIVEVAVAATSPAAIPEAAATVLQADRVVNATLVEGEFVPFVHHFLSLLID